MGSEKNANFNLPAVVTSTRTLRCDRDSLFLLYYTSDGVHFHSVDYRFSFEINCSQNTDEGVYVYTSN